MISVTMKTSIHYFFGLATLLLLTALFPEKGYGQIKVVAKVRAVHCALNTNGAISLSVTGGTPPYQFQWSNGSQDQDLEDLPEGQYEVKVIDSRELVTTQRIKVDTYTSLKLSILAKDASSSNNNDGQLAANVSGGKGPYQYHWISLNDSNHSFPSNSSLSSLSKGNYVLVVHDANGCNVVAQARINQAGSPHK
jgi:hypothetical protein